MSRRILLIDPTTTEWNRGGYCYLPYLFYDYLKHEKGFDVTFYENFTAPEKFDLVVDENTDIYISLCTPPQKDICLELHQSFPTAKFFGYYGFIEELGFPMLRISPEQLVAGMRHQGKSFESLQSILLSDCDAHIKGEFKGTFYPFNTSYSCSRGCQFCPGSKNNNHKIDSMTLKDVETKLAFYYTKDYKNIHFTDENFFIDIDRAYYILCFCQKYEDLNLIILGDSESILKFINRYGRNFLHLSHVRLLEIGFEGFNLLSIKGGEKHLETCRMLYTLVPDLVYWLTLTFAPGETLTTLAETGQFLHLYGKDPEDMLPRLRTNGTEGGLGQFFQQYPDLYTEYLEGLHSPFNATRLYPSFIPKSFLESRIKRINTGRFIELEYWCDLYNVPTAIDPHFVNCTVQNILNLLEEDSYLSQASICIALAIAARLGIIE